MYLCNLTIETNKKFLKLGRNNALFTLSGIEFRNDLVSNEKEELNSKFIIFERFN